MRGQGAQGFTLIELILTVTLLGILSVIVGGVLLNLFSIYHTSQRISDLDWQGLMILERMSNDIHLVRSPNDVSTIAAAQLSFTNSAGTSISYQVSGSNLLRNSIVLGSGVQSLALSYYDENGNVTATPSAVRYIKISLNLTQSPITTNFTTLSALRVLS